MEKDIKNFLDQDLSDFTNKIALQAGKKIAQNITSTLSDPDDSLISAEISFKLNLNDRWGLAILYLRATIALCQEIGSLKLKTCKRRKKNRCKRMALARLQARACQISGEAVALLEAGYADGAMARWRSLHEITVISILLADGDEDLANRFVDHEAIDANNALTEFIQSQVPLGARRPSRQVLEASAKTVDGLSAKYGANYRKSYGWAAHHLKQSRVTFRDLEQKANRSVARWAYKLASFNVHTSPRTFVFSLSSSDDPTLILAGASNRGLEEPGIRVATELSIITCNIFEHNFSFDDVASMHAILYLRSKAAKTFNQIARALSRETS